jgi:hypothetical protein
VGPRVGQCCNEFRVGQVAVVVAGPGWH